MVDMSEYNKMAILQRLEPADLLDAVTEEHADVEVCFELLGWEDQKEREQIRRDKLRRWANSVMEVDYGKEQA